VERERHELHTTLGKVEAYVLSVYLVSMTITTVGYGDITAETTWERIGYSLFFIVCAFSWGELIAGIFFLATFFFLSSAPSLPLGELITGIFLLGRFVLFFVSAACGASYNASFFYDAS
jgi:hypothetical protein